MTPRDGYTCEWVECLHADGLADARASLCFQVQTQPTLISDLTHAYKRLIQTSQTREGLGLTELPEARACSELERPDRHPREDLGVADRGAPPLVLADHLLEQLDQALLDARRRPVLAGPRAVLRADPLELVVVLEEEAQPLVAHVLLEVRAELALQLRRLAPARERVRLDLLGDLLGRVGEEDRRVVVRRGHLARGALQRREEFGVEERGLAAERVVFRSDLVRDVARDAEVGVLVDGAGDEAGQCVVPGEGDLEGRREGRRGLDRRERRLADVRTSLEAERRARGAVGDALPDLADVDFDIDTGNDKILVYNADRNGTKFVGIASTALINVVTGNLEVTGNISCAGTVTYDDVTFVDSIGVVTARTGIELGAGSITPVISFEAATETTTTTSASTIDSFTAATYRSAQYQIQITQGSNYHVTTLNVVHDGSQVYIMEFGTIRTGVALATFDADINSGNVRVRGTPTTSNSTVFKLSKVLTRV